jgi:CDI toxin restriction endonuclease-like domain
LGANLPHAFPVVDCWLDGVVASIKSIDLRAATYQSAERLTYRLNEYIDKLALFDGGQIGFTRIDGTAIVGRELRIAIPGGSTTAVQQAAMDAARLRAKAFDIDLKFTEF